MLVQFDEWLQNKLIAEGVKQTVQEIQTERERIAEMERLYEQLREKVDGMHQDFEELQQRIAQLEAKVVSP